MMAMDDNSGPVYTSPWGAPGKDYHVVDIK